MLSTPLFLPETIHYSLLSALYSLITTHRFFPIRQIHHNSLTRFDQVLRRDHDLFAPLTRTGSKDWLIQQTRFQEGSESGRLPAKGRDRTDHISGRFFDHIWLRHLDV